MREIKFRAWDKENKEMIYPKGILFDGRIVEFSCGMLEPFEGCEIMQFTGIYDKNGREIYEGDIVIVDQKETPAEVIFENGCFYTPIGISRYRLGGWYKENLEVVGNIYEDSYLLEIEE